MTAEIGLLERNKETYYGVMLNANFASFYSSAVATRLSVIQKPLIVDPNTAPLGWDLGVIRSGGKLKASYQRLVERMDAATGSNVLCERIERGNLTPADFGVGASGSKASDLTDVFVAGALDVQSKCLDRASSKRNQSLKKYMEAQDGGASNGLARGPEFIIAPYFCSPDVTSDWFKVNVKLFKAAARSKKGAYAVLCMGGEAGGWKSMARKAASVYTGAGGFLVWVNGFNDTRASVSQLRQYKEMLSVIKNAQKPVIALYAGYYALVLSAQPGITGYVRGIGGGEMRDLGSKVTGGGFPPRYYLRGIHTHALQEPAAAALAASQKIRCACKACRNAMKKAGGQRHEGVEKYERMIQVMGQVPLKEHFMHAHKREIEYVGQGGRAARDAITENLTAADMTRISRAGVLTHHMDRWRASLS